MGMTSEFRSVFFWRAVLAEFVATSLFLFFVCGVTLKWDTDTPTIIRIAFSFGLNIAILVHIFGPSSGGHLNPAVTIGLLFGRQITILRAMLYILAQCAGAITGAAVCYAVTPTEARGVLGNLSLQRDVTQWQALGLEVLTTFLLVMTVYASTDKNRNEKGFLPALAIGLAVLICHLTSIPYDGCSINPARALGPAVIMNIWHPYHWVFWVGPILGGILAGLFYPLVFAHLDGGAGHVEITAASYILENRFSNDMKTPSHLAQSLSGL